jgi:pyruvate,water dikinase
MTPLCASAWVPANELGLRQPFHAMGVLPSRELAIPDDPADQMQIRVDGDRGVVEVVRSR